MANATLEQLIEAARALPSDERRRLREWLEEQERFQKALGWIKEHRAEYLGQWVVLDGDRLISHGRDARKVYDEALVAGIRTPFLKRIIEEELPFGGW